MRLVFGLTFGGQFALASYWTNKRLRPLMKWAEKGSSEKWKRVNDLVTRLIVWKRNQRFLISDVRARARSPKPAQAGPGKPSQAQALLTALRGLRLRLQFFEARAVGLSRRLSCACKVQAFGRLSCTILVDFGCCADVRL